MIRGLLVLSIVIFVITLGYEFASPVVKNRMLQGKMVDIARNRANKSDQALHADVMKFIREKDIDLGPQQVMVESHDEKVYIAARYSTEVRFLSYIREYEFFPSSDKKASMYWKRSKRSTLAPAP